MQTKTKEEICEILQVNKNNLRQIENRGKLEERLEHKGYKLISKEKRGEAMYIMYKRLTQAKRPIQTYVIMYFIPIYMKSSQNIICIEC